MAEGHTVHRLGERIARAMTGQTVRATASYGPMREVAARLDGATITGADVHGKHLFVTTSSRPILHVHLGMDGSGGVMSRDTARTAVGRDRLRLTGETVVCEINRPRLCELVDARGMARIRARLGADPLREDADPDAAFARFTTLDLPVGAALLDQSAIAGAGNVYRAEVLFRQKLDPLRAASEVSRESFDAVWNDLVRLMPYGVASGEMLTREPELLAWDRYRAGGGRRPHAIYAVYRLDGRPCARCGTPIATRDLLGRRLYWCAGCQTG